MNHPHGGYDEGEQSRTRVGPAMAASSAIRAHGEMGDRPLPVLGVEDLARVFRGIPKNKAGGSEFWQPQELMVLPRVYKEGLLRWLRRAAEGLGSGPMNSAVP